MKRVPKHIRQMLDGFREKLETGKDDRDASQTAMLGLLLVNQEIQAKASTIEGKTPEDEEVLKDLLAVLQEEFLLLLKLGASDVMERLKELKDEISKDDWGRDREVA